MGKNNETKKLEKRILSQVQDASNLEELKWILLNTNVPELSNDYKGVNILILNTPCEGFGDLIFALKLSKILEYEYDANVSIATTTPDILIKMSGRSDNVYKLAENINDPEFDKKVSQCKRYTTSHKIFKQDGSTLNTLNFDLFFDAPIVQNYHPDLSAVKNIISKANLFNTFSFSEYNDYLDKGFDFNMGIGGERNGMLFLPEKLVKIESKEYITDNLEINGKFCLIYIAPINGWGKCLSSFIEMILTKYSNLNEFTIVCPHFIIDDLKKYYNHFFPFFTNVIMYDNEENKKTPVIYKPKIQDLDKPENTLIFRGNILPVNNSVILALMKYSVSDILLTGDQSITDMLTVSADKNIFYQIADWKENFAQRLSELMPQKYLENYKTSCGSLSALKKGGYRGNYTQFVHDWNFSEISGGKMKTILTISNILKKGGTGEKNELYSLIKEYTDIINEAKSYKAAMKKFVF